MGVSTHQSLRSLAMLSWHGFCGLSSSPTTQPLQDNAEKEKSETLIDVPDASDEELQTPAKRNRKTGGSFQISPRELESLISPMVRSSPEAAPWEAQLNAIRQQKSASREPLELLQPNNDVRELTSSPSAHRQPSFALTTPLSVQTNLPASAATESLPALSVANSSPSSPLTAPHGSKVSPTKPVFPISHVRRTPFDDYEEAKSSGRENSVQRFLRDPSKDSPLSSPRKILGTTPEDHKSVMQESRRRLANMRPGITAWPTPPPPQDYRLKSTASSSENSKSRSEPPDRAESVEGQAEKSGEEAGEDVDQASQVAPFRSEAGASPAESSPPPLSQSMESSGLGGMASSGAETVLSRSVDGNRLSRPSKARPSSRRRFNISVSPSPSRPPARPPLPSASSGQTKESPTPSSQQPKPRKFVIRSTSREVVSDVDAGHGSSTPLREVSSSRFS